MNKASVKGLSTVETLVAVVVVVALAGVVMPALASANHREADRTEMSELRQLGIAQGIYTEETGAIPMSTLTLVQRGLVSPNVCSSPLDKMQNGTANAITKSFGMHSAMYLRLGTPYRNSYVGLREYAFPYKWMDQYVKPMSGGGWLVSLTTSQRMNDDGSMIWSSGTYRRLMLDGSVQVKRHEPVELKVGNDVMNADHDLFLFLDGSKEWKTSFVSGSH